MDKKIAIFYHCYLANSWKVIIEDQISKLFKYGLYYAADKIYSNVISNDEESFKEFNKMSPIKFTIQKIPNQFEYPTIKKLYDFCINDINNDYIVLYFHAKNTSRILNENVEDWRKLMDYFNIEKWKYCYDILYTENYDVCGVEYCEGPPKDSNTRHFPGNFWWSTSKYIKRLDNPIITNNRFYYEQHWLCVPDDVKAYNFWKSNIDHYSSPCPRYLYENKYSL